MTQQEQVKNAKRAYLMRLNSPKDGMSALRFAVYLDSGNGLKCLWPSDSHVGKKSKELLHNQVYTDKRNYPAFHFALSGCGYSKSDTIRQTLNAINPELKVEVISAWNPSNS